MNFPAIPANIHTGTNWPSLKLSHEESIRYVKYNNPQLACILHILQNRKEHGSIQDTVNLLQPIQKGSHVNTLEQFYIQKY